MRVSLGLSLEICIHLRLWVLFMKPNVTKFNEWVLYTFRNTSMVIGS